MPNFPTVIIIYTHIGHEGSCKDTASDEDGQGLFGDVVPAWVAAAGEEEEEEEVCAEQGGDEDAEDDGEAFCCDDVVVVQGCDIGGGVLDVVL